MFFGTTHDIKKLKKAFVRISDWMELGATHT